ncbi:lytic transglycosylase domain-containing protein [Dictyobacter kobayashii]|uniref:Transglycosylase SLT domain-containing protein n=1 Tax=Dictyobacter kobayashii TaxID=2014872 RepID=A0A402AEN4_9CHLR|nr:lytic transglycosylase domain-containing protein [Dictyobacter kobayashii]GCE17544.1 hypothetical protein KDK_13440 [Dictyobacter kobayashii]
MRKLLLIGLVIVAAALLYPSFQATAQHKSISHVTVTSYVSMARQAATDAGISPDIFERQIEQESKFDPRALSPAGAQGIAQFMPATARALGIDPWNPEQALKGAAHLMASYNKQYHGNYAAALAAYNAGPGAVKSAVDRCRSQWQRCLPAETQHYITVILAGQQQ